MPIDDTMKITRACEFFNGSERPATLAGVARSLGAPTATVRSSANESSVVLVTVAWELSWYCFEVDLADDERAVTMIARGTDLADLPVEDRIENATVDGQGHLQLGSA